MTQPLSGRWLTLVFICLGIFFGGPWLPFLCVLSNCPKVDFYAKSYYFQSDDFQVSIYLSSANLNAKCSERRRNRSQSGTSQKDCERPCLISGIPSSDSKWQKTCHCGIILYSRKCFIKSGALAFLKVAYGVSGCVVRNETRNSAIQGIVVCESGPWQWDFRTGRRGPSVIHPTNLKIQSWSITS